MISDRSPVLSLEADTVLDEYLDGGIRRKKRDQRLKRIVFQLPVKTCGCPICRRFEQKEGMHDSG